VDEPYCPMRENVGIIRSTVIIEIWLSAEISKEKEKLSNKNKGLNIYQTKTSELK